MPVAAHLAGEFTHACGGSGTFADLREVLITSLNDELRTPLNTVLGHTELLEGVTDLSQSVAISLQATRLRPDRARHAERATRDLAELPIGLVR